MLLTSPSISFILFTERQTAEHLNKRINRARYLLDAVRAGRGGETMKVYQGDTMDGKPQHHTFVEVESDGYLEVKGVPRMDNLDEATKNRLRAFTRRVKREEEKGKFFYVRMARRYFQVICPAPNLKLIGEF